MGTSEIIQPVTSGRGHTPELFELISPGLLADTQQNWRSDPPQPLWLQSSQGGAPTAHPVGRELLPARKQDGKKESRMWETREGNKPGAAELGFQHPPAEHSSSPCICHTTRNSGKEHSKHHLSQITNTADHYFISCKAEAWGLGWVLVLRWGGGGGYVCFVWFPHLPQLKTLPAFYSQESQHSLRLKPMQPSLFPGFINYGIPSQSYKFHLVKRIHCTDKHWSVKASITELHRHQLMCITYDLLNHTSLLSQYSLRNQSVRALCLLAKAKMPLGECR